MNATWTKFQTQLQAAGIINEDIAKARKAWDAEAERIAYAVEAGYESQEEFSTSCGECADSEHDCYDYASDDGAGCIICNICWRRISGRPDSDSDW